MASSLVLADSTPGGESISFFDPAEAMIRDAPNNFGSSADDQRVLELSISLGATPGSSTKDAIMALAARVNRILGRAVMARTRGLGRIVTLTHQPDTMTVATIWTVWGGSLEMPPEVLTMFILNGTFRPTLKLHVERRASSAEITVNGGSGLVNGLAPVSHVFLNPVGGGTFGVNTAGLVDGSLWQTTKFTLSPTIGTPANGDILYFGNIWAATATEWDRIIMGLSAAAFGTYTMVWEYWNGSAWTSFTPSTNDFKTTRDFDTTRALGQIIFPALSGWAPTTINSVLAYWVRARVTSVTTSTNLVLNPSLETNSTGYALNAGSTITRSSTAAFYGGFGLLVTTANIASSGAEYGGTTELPVTPGLSYTMSVAARLASPNSKPMQMTIGWYTAADATITFSTVLSTLTSTTFSRTAVTPVTATAPALSHHARLFVLTNGAQGVFDFWLDGFQFEQAAAATPYMDGSIPGGAWTGTANASTSVRTIAPPVRMNGPIGSLYGCVELPASGAGSVTGDAPADALVHLDNLSATALGGIKAAVLTGQVAPVGLGATVKPPLIFPFAAANLFVSGGDNGLAVEADANTPYTERVKCTIGAGSISGLSDRSQHFSGTQYVTVTPSGGDKITGWGVDDAFFSEHMVYFESLTNSYTTIASQWDATGVLLKWWLGVRNKKLTFKWKTSSGHTFTCTGTSTLKTGQWYLLTGEFRQDQSEGRVYVNANKETEVSGSGSGDDVLSGAATVPYRIGKTVSMTGEVGLVGRIAWSWTVNTSIRSVFGGDTDDYFVPTVKRVPTAISQTSVYYEYDDYLATATVLDTGNGTLKPGTRTTAPVNTNDVANALAGYFVGAPVGGSGSRLIGMSIATTLGEEYAGPYRAYIAVAPPSSSFSSTSKLEFMSQWNIGDNTLPFARSGMRLPSTHDVNGVNSGYHLLWVGDVYLPPEGFYQGYRGSGSTQNAMQFNLFLRHDLAIGQTFLLDCLYLFPLDGFFGEYQSFRKTYDANYLVAQNEGVSFDSRGPGPAIIAPTTAAGYVVQDRNPYAYAQASPPKLYPQRKAWVVGVPLRAYDASDNDYVYRRAVAGESLQPRVIARPLYNFWAAP